MISSARLEGVWVDGGVLDNLPRGALGPPEQTLGLRLGGEYEGLIRIDTFEQYLMSIVRLAVASGEARLSESRSGGLRANIALNPQPLGLLDFKVTSEVLKQVSERSYNSVFSHFGKSPEPRDGWKAIFQ